MRGLLVLGFMFGVPSLVWGAPNEVVAVRSDPCIREILSPEDLLGALRVEVTSLLGRDTTFVKEEEEPSYLIQLGCRKSQGVSVFVTRQNPAAAIFVEVSLKDAPPGLKPRTLALSITEAMRGLRRETQVEVTKPSKPTAGGANLSRLRLTSGLTIGLGALSLASLVIGSGLYGIAVSGPEGQQRPELIPSGVGMFALGGAAFIGGGVTLTLFLLERRKAIQNRNLVLGPERIGR